MYIRCEAKVSGMCFAHICSVLLPLSPSKNSSLGDNHPGSQIQKDLLAQIHLMDDSWTKAANGGNATSTRKWWKLASCGLRPSKELSKSGF